MSNKIEEIKKHGVTSKGKANLIKHLEVVRLTPRQAILAKCCECMRLAIFVTSSGRRLTGKFWDSRPYDFRLWASQCQY